MSSPCYLITAASGNVGEHLIPILLAHPSRPTLILPTTNAAKLASKIPSDADASRLHIFEGRIQNPTWVQSLLKEHKVTGVWLNLIGVDELFTTLNLLDAIKNSGTAKHVVYMSGTGDFSIDAIKSGALLNDSCGPAVVKFVGEAKLRHGTPPRSEKGGISWTIIGPSLFFSNDLRSKQSIMGGLFDQPLGSKGVTRVDPQNIALAVANALVDDGRQWGGRKFCIGARKIFTVQQTAELWSKALGREVKPLLSDEAGLKAFEEGCTPVIGPIWARDMRLMYEIFEHQEFGMSEQEYEDQIKLLEREPADYEEFVERTVGEWRP